MIENKLVDGEELERPFLSVIVSTRNEEKYIGKLLDSLVNQTYPRDRFEVIIVDGMSRDATLKIAETYKDRLNLRIFENPRIRSTFGFNKGIDEAKGRLFIILGAHSYVCEGFIEQEVDTFVRLRKDEPKLAGVGGKCVNEYENAVGKLVGLLYSSFFTGSRSCRYKMKPHFSDSVMFGIYDKEIVVANGKFDEDFLRAGNDDELTKRLGARGFKLFTDPKIVSHYFTRSSFRGFFEQTYNCGVARGIIVRKGNYKPEWLNPASLWFVPASFLFYEMFVLLLFAFSSSFFVLAFVPMLLYWMINVLVSFHLLIKTKALLCLALPPTYFLFHNVLGLSSLLGLLFKKKAFI